MFIYIIFNYFSIANTVRVICGTGCVFDYGVCRPQFSNPCADSYPRMDVGSLKIYVNACIYIYFNEAFMHKSA